MAGDSEIEMNELFTANEEMDSITPGDATVDITAYVDAIEGSKLVGATVKKALYKCILNNNQGRRIRILLWEQTATEYERRIHSREVLRITRGKALPVNMTYVRHGEDLMPMEISIQRNSKIELLGKFSSGEDTEIAQYRKCSMAKIGVTEGRIVVDGFIKVKFSPAVDGNTSYGIGAITDGYYKLVIQITQFNEVKELVEGSHVSVKGEIKLNKYEARYVQAASMDHVRKLDNTTLSAAQLKKGFHAIPFKRACDDVESVEDKENSPPKKDKIAEITELSGNTLVLL